MAEYKSLYTGQQIDAGIGKANTALQQETDPIFSASPSADITSQDISNWNAKSDFSGSYNDLTNKPELFSGDYDDLTNKPTIPSALSDLTDDSTHRVVTDEEKTTWSGKSDFSGSYNDLSNKPSIPSATSDLTNDSGFIDNTVNDLTNYYDKTTVDSKISSVYKYKGTVSTYGDLPSSSLTVGDVYNIETADSTHGIKAGDNVAWTGTGWDVLAGTVDLSGYQTKIDSSHKLSSDLVDDTSATNLFVTSSEKSTWSGKQDTLIAGTNITIGTDGKTISATDTTYSNATTESAGLMSSDDKTKLNGIASGAGVNVQANWNESDTTSDSYIQNKPNIPTVPTNVSAFTNDAGYLTSHQDISGKQDIMQYATMPTASVSTVGKIVQYTGTTDANYTNGYFYIGTSDGGNPATYSWENINVQAGGQIPTNMKVYYIGENDAQHPFVFSENPTGLYFMPFKEQNSAKFYFKLTPNHSSENIFYLAGSYIHYFEAYDPEQTGNRILGTFNDFGYYKDNYNDYFLADYRHIEQRSDNQAGMSIYGNGRKVNMLNGSTVAYIYKKWTFNVLPESSVTPTTNDQLTRKGYVDNLLTTYSGYDATKTQVLKNVNGTFTWIDET